MIAKMECLDGGEETNGKEGEIENTAEMFGKEEEIEVKEEIEKKLKERSTTK